MKKCKTVECPKCGMIVPSKAALMAAHNRFYHAPQRLPKPESGPHHTMAETNDQGIAQAAPSVDNPRSPGPAGKRQHVFTIDL